MNVSPQPFSNQPLVSVIIPAYNAEAFIEKTLTSVLSQTYGNLEVIVIDDGSQDQTAEIVQKYAQKDPRICLFKQQNSGVAAARNLGIEKSKGELIAFLDADDIWYPQNIEKQVRCFLTSKPSVGLVYSWSVEIDEKDLLCGGFHGFESEGNVYMELLIRNFIGNASAALIRRSCFEKVGGYDCELKAKAAQGCEDWDIYLRIAECYQIKVVREFLVGYRQVTNSMSCNYNSMAKSHQFVLDAARKKHPEIPNVVYRWSCSDFFVYLADKSSRNGNPRESLFWLYKSSQFDLTMILLRHDFYILSLKNLFKIIVNLIRGQPQVQTTSHLNRLVKIRQLLPSKMYEKVRWLGLKFRLNSTDFV